MADDGRIVWQVDVDTKKAKVDIEDVTKTIKNETSKWDDAAKKSSNSMSESFSGMLKKLAAGFSAAKIGKALLDLGKDAVQAASDLQEVQNVVDTTFGSNANKIETWAKNAGTQFGLTETQAKRFTSTMGAMLKSSGLAGDEIVNVSTDLAGLAADMASFYNLDFEEAFSKIRSGMSGMTMPLKELGIDMSVDTMNAFALEKGLEKTFNQMSQSEQTMLRYQYLMKATADAQGDFAKTTDGYANGLRLLESNLTTLKTNLGTVLLDYVNPLLQGLNALFPEEKRSDSLLDQLAEVNIKKEEKLEEIKAIRAEADELIKVLENLGEDENAGSQLEKLANGANKLNASSASTWSSVLSSFQSVDGLNISDTVGDVEELASALAGESLTTGKAQAWQTFLGALSNNADAMSKLTGTSAEDTAEWLKQLSEAAKGLDEGDAEAWSKLMSALVGGISVDTDEGKKFVETLTENFLAMGKDSETAVSGLKALGFSTDEIEKKQETWLKTCKELAKTIPGLSSIIDTNTGEIKGGIPALKQYADEWERTAKYQAEIEAIRSAQNIYNTNNNQAELDANATVAKAKAYARMRVSKATGGLEDEQLNLMANQVDELMQGFVDKGYTSWDEIKKYILSDTDNNKRRKMLSDLGIDSSNAESQYGWILSAKDEDREALEAYAEAAYRAALIEKERPYVLEEINRMEEEAAKKYGKTKEEIEAEAKAAEEAAQAMTTLERAANGDANALTDVQKAVNNADKALQEMSDHAQSVRSSVENAVNGIIKGFDRMGKAGDDNRTRQTELVNEWQEATEKYAAEISKYRNSDGSFDYESLKRMSDAYDDLSDEAKDAYNELAKLYNEQDKINKSLEEYSTDTMKGNLQSQVDFMTEYLSNLEKARSYGLSNELLAMLSDGSAESAEYLASLVGDGSEAAKTAAQEVDQLYKQVQEEKKKFTEGLTEQQLAGDSVYQSLAANAKQAVDSLLELTGGAYTNTTEIVEAVASGLGDNLSLVTEQVNNILDQLDRLNGYGVEIDFGGFGKIVFKTSTGEIAKPARMGLLNVPHDDYLARLHEGERVLTAQEAQKYNALLNGGVAGFGLDELGGVMRDNVKPGGNVYLDGKVVGSVISAQQGRSYRQLQRSGWQS